MFFQVAGRPEIAQPELTRTADVICIYIPPLNSFRGSVSEVMVRGKTLVSYGVVRS